MSHSRHANDITAGNSIRKDKFQWNFIDVIFVVVNCSAYATQNASASTYGKQDIHWYEEKPID